MIKVSNINLSIDDSMGKLSQKAAKKIGIKPNQIKKLEIVKESIDARKKDEIKFTYTVNVIVDNEDKIMKKVRNKDVNLASKKAPKDFPFGENEIKNRPIIIGMGPAGLFAGLVLAKNGYKPLIFERGGDVVQRTKDVDAFWSGERLKTDSNVQFGEGGAGTFSDGKLTTRIKDLRCADVLRWMVKAGAPEEIIYKNKPHIGTDILKNVVVNLREEIKSLGGEVRFNTKVEEILLEEGRAVGVIAQGEKILSDNIVTAIGHSARDTYKMMYEKKIDMESKPFAMGVRVEHPQNLIDQNQYGKYAGHERLRAAEYKLTYTTQDKERSVYSFCMCPGGVVVAASSEENMVVTNGMSYYARDKENANSALVVSVGKEDFGDNPMDAIEFQRKYEKLAFEVGGGDYKAPVQMIKDFLQDRKSESLGSVEPSYKPGYVLKDMRECLPAQIIEPMKEALMNFERKIKGFALGDGVMTGVETRTSAPVRISRERNLESTNVQGLYPCGEGAGYAGGIISAAVDGIKCAEAVMMKWGKNTQL